MSVTVKLPPVLRPVVGGAKALEAEGDSIAAVIADLAARHPGLALHFYDERGAIRRNIMFIHRDIAFRPPEAPDVALAPGDEVTITNALAGGSESVGGRVGTGSPTPPPLPPTPPPEP